jgi:hypothetical protein
VLQGPGFPWRETRQKLIALMSDLFEKLQAQGDFVIADPNLSALLLLGGLRTVIRFGKQPRPADLPTQVLNVFIQTNKGAANASGNRRRSRRRLDHFGSLPPSGR